MHICCGDECSLLNTGALQSRDDLTFYVSKMMSAYCSWNHIK